MQHAVVASRRSGVVLLAQHRVGWVPQADGLADAVRALQEKLGRLEGDDLAAASDQEALATSLATVLSKCADHP